MFRRKSCTFGERYNLLAQARSLFTAIVVDAIQVVGFNQHAIDIMQLHLCNILESVDSVLNFGVLLFKVLQSSLVFDYAAVSIQHNSLKVDCILLQVAGLLLEVQNARSERHDGLCLVEQ